MFKGWHLIETTFPFIKMKRIEPIPTTRAGTRAEIKSSLFNVLCCLFYFKVETWINYILPAGQLKNIAIPLLKQEKRNFLELKRTPFAAVNRATGIVKQRYIYYKRLSKHFQ